MTKMPVATVAPPMLSQKLCQAEIPPMDFQVITPRKTSHLPEAEGVHTEYGMYVHTHVRMCACNYR